MTIYQSAANPDDCQKQTRSTRRMAPRSGRGKTTFRGRLLRRKLPLAASLVLVLSLCQRSSGQSYSIDWHTVSGGGGASSGGPFSLSGTIGQPEAGNGLTGGFYSLAGGFWALDAAQSPGAPALNVLLSTTNTAVVWWPSPSAGWTLQQNSSLVATNWTSPAEAVTDDGKIRSIVVMAPAGNRFYRLAKP